MVHIWGFHRKFLVQWSISIFFIIVNFNFMHIHIEWKLYFNVCVCVCLLPSIQMCAFSFFFIYSYLLSYYKIATLITCHIACRMNNVLLNRWEKDKRKPLFYKKCIEVAYYGRMYLISADSFDKMMKIFYPLESTSLCPIKCIIMIP